MRTRIMDSAVGVRLLAVSVGALIGFIVSLSDIDSSTADVPRVRRKAALRLAPSWEPPPIADRSGPLDLNDGIIQSDRPKAESQQVGMKPKPTPYRVDTDKLGRVVNPHNYYYTIDPKGSCANKDIFLVAYVHTAPDHRDRRALVRRTWANATHYERNKIRVFFAVGWPSTEKAQRDLEQEASEHGDIIQENYVDVYHNLSIKAVGALRWVTSRCKQAKFILKTDDDVFVNLFGLLPHLDDLYRHGVNSTGLLMCLVWRRMHVLRQGKWAIPKEAIPDEYYPPYCSGIAYVMSPDVASAIYRASAHVPFFWVDDVYITGIVPKAIGLRHVDIGRLFFGRNEVDWLLSGDDWYKYLFSHLRDVRHYEEMWHVLRRRGLSEPIPKMSEVAAGKLAVKYGPKKPPEWFMKKLEMSRRHKNNRLNDRKNVQVKQKKNALAKNGPGDKQQETGLI